jgi:perosamine synthetase
VDELTRRKREILSYYKDKLLAYTGLVMNPEPLNTVNGAWMPTVVFDASLGVTRERLQTAFSEQKIDARVFFHPLSGLPMFSPRPDNNLAWDIPTRAINLPSYHDMTTQEQDRVVEVILRCLHETT